MRLRAIKGIWQGATQWRFELCIFALVCALTAAGAFANSQNALNDLTFRMVSKPASGQIVLVQIDPKSLAALDTWPWPRSTHAKLIERLSAAGAHTVAVDIDFSSPSQPQEDAALAHAIENAGGRVVLPSFVQHENPGISAALTETNPLPALRDHALIGNANVFAPDGEQREASLGLYLPDGRYRPTFAALIAQRGRAFVTDFNIDFGIDRTTIPRLSYIDVLQGRFDASAVKGKRVIVGATALELGDRVPVPLHGVVAGVEVQALVAESILQNRMLWTPGFLGAMAIVALVLVLLRPSTTAWTVNRFGARLAAAFGALSVAPLIATAVLPVLIETAAGFGSALLALLFVGGRELSLRAQSVLRERSSSNIRRAMISLIVEESSDGVVVTDGKGRVELCNQRAASLLSTTQSASTGRNAVAFLPRFEDMPQADDDSAPRRSELSLACDDGEILLEVGARRLGMKIATGAAWQDAKFDVYTLRDVTTIRKAEEAERRAQEERFMAERAKNNFIANMSHELRTPLNAIIGFSELMAAQTLGPMGSPAYVEYADVVAKSGHHLLAVVNNVLEISRMDSEGEELQLEDVDFVECAQSCVSLMRGTRDYKGQTITVEPTVGCATLRAPMRPIKQVLSNLLSNAIKFSDDAGMISIKSSVEGDDFCFEVADEGVGIDASVMPHLTKLFYQSDQSFSRKFDGMGVGLYLVNCALKRMKGSLTFDSAPGRGTRVRVVLCGAAAAATAEAA